MAAFVSPLAGWSAAFRPGLIAVRKFAAPFLLIQLLAVAVLAAYWLSPGFRDACRSLAAAKAAGGLWLAAGVTVLAAAVLPEFAKLAAGDRKLDRKRLADFAFNAAYFALAGVMTDWFYWLQSAWWGDRADLPTILAKVLTDQIGFTLLIALPMATVLYRWHAHGFALAPMRRELRHGFIRRRMLPVVLPNWAYWVPMTALIYALPLALQFVFWVPVMGAWSLLLVFLAGGGGQAAEEEISPVPSAIAAD